MFKVSISKQATYALYGMSFGCGKLALGRPWIGHNIEVQSGSVQHSINGVDHPGTSLIVVVRSWSWKKDNSTSLTHGVNVGGIEIPYVQQRQWKQTLCPLKQGIPKDIGVRHEAHEVLFRLPSRLAFS